MSRIETTNVPERSSWTAAAVKRKQQDQVGEALVGAIKCSLELQQWLASALLFVVCISSLLMCTRAQEQQFSVVYCEEPSQERRNITLLDGGLGHLLKERGVQTPGLKFEDQFLAGVLANAEQPEVVCGIHQEYIRAGADVITTNNFVATRHSLGKLGLDGRLVELTEAAGRCARKSQLAGGRPVQVAGSLPPLKESYQVDSLGPCGELQQEYNSIARVLAPSVDLLLCETMSTVKEAMAAVQAAGQTGLSVWVSFSLEDSLKAVLRSGEPLKGAIDQVTATGVPKTILVNCCAPQAISAAMPVLKEFKTNGGVDIGCYGNGFRETTTQWIKGTTNAPFEVNLGEVIKFIGEDFSPDGIITAEAYSRYAKDWVKMGATVIGGCCGIGPDHIATLKRTL